MAQREVVTLIDDIDGTPAEGTILFSLQSTQYEIELSEKNRVKLFKSLTPYITNARKVPKTRAKRK